MKRISMMISIATVVTITLTMFVGCGNMEDKQDSESSITNISDVTSVITEIVETTGLVTSSAVSDKTTAESENPIVDNKTKELIAAYENYYSLLNAIKKFGGVVETDFDSDDYSCLIDFENNGVPELLINKPSEFTLYGQRDCTVYGYNDGKLINHYNEVSGGGGFANISLNILQDSNGKKYLQEYISRLFEYEETLYTVDNGKWVDVNNITSSDLVECDLIGTIDDVLLFLERNIPKIESISNKEKEIILDYIQKHGAIFYDEYFYDISDVDLLSSFFTLMGAYSVLNIADEKQDNFYYFYPDTIEKFLQEYHYDDFFIDDYNYRELEAWYGDRIWNNERNAFIWEQKGHGFPWYEESVKESYKIGDYYYFIIEMNHYTLGDGELDSSDMILYKLRKNDNGNFNICFKIKIQP